MKKSYYGVTVGILMVETYFRRFVGDIGNAETWPFPVQYKVVHGATPDKMGAFDEHDVLEPFRLAAMELIEGGCTAITTTCGFLGYYQKDLAKALPVPVATSALLQVPIVERIIQPDRTVGVLTYSAEKLTGPYLEACGAPADSPVFGMDPGSEFCRSIREGDPSVPYEVWEREVVETARAFAQAQPDLGAIVLECTNLTPFSHQISQATGLPVFDSISLVNWFRAGIVPSAYPHR
ncbi:aspartate/glutamate racemase family protein [Salipiger sp. P9]|uniref:aspartate/glutamate racemase family protein n=1 Tax=Salipiger pentaromativorans TaxID=2943193 RepID=UPI002158573E|nr:aspartate/glutamate racemase family protein [Salipiger pentaromativorans]MCR8547485.1 aspartate/glutamate racemase family protein [Salipiger pentaromativorans]